MRRVSLNARRAFNDPFTAETEVALFHFDHPDLAAPVRLSSDPTERLSIEPLSYGTRSTWQTADGSPFLFIIADHLMPSDKADAAPEAQLEIFVPDEQVATLLRSISGRAKVRLALVLAGTPNLVEREWTGLELTQAQGSGSTIRIALSGEALQQEPWPWLRMSRGVFPALFR